MSPLRLVVTGGSSGIGAEVARQYAEKGAQVALFARRREKLEAVAAECRALGAKEVRVLVGDTTDIARVNAAVRELAEAWGGIDRAYLNAGGYGASDSEAMRHAREVEWTSNGFSAAAAESVMRVNYLGVTYWLEALLPIMRTQRSGTIAVTGAQTADRGFPAHGPYAASKAAVRALCDSLRADASRFGITLSLLEPGCVVSELTENQCCDSMPFLQPTKKAVTKFIEGVEEKRAVVRWPAHASLTSKLAAAVPRTLFDLWAVRRFPGAD